MFKVNFHGQKAGGQGSRSKLMVNVQGQKVKSQCSRSMFKVQGQKLRRLRFKVNAQGQKGRMSIVKVRVQI